MWGSYGFQVLSFLILTRLNGCFWLSFVPNGSFFFVFHDMFLFIYYYCYYYLFLWFGFTSMWFNTLVLEIWINQKKRKKEKKRKERRPWAYLKWGSYGFEVLSFLILTVLNGCFWLSIVRRIFAVLGPKFQPLRARFLMLF